MIGCVNATHPTVTSTASPILDSEESLFPLEILAAAVSQKAFSEHELNVEFICLECKIIYNILNLGWK